MQWEIAYRGPYSAVIKLWDGNLQVLAKVNAMSQRNVNDKCLCVRARVMMKEEVEEF